LLRCFAENASLLPALVVGFFYVLASFNLSGVEEQNSDQHLIYHTINKHHTTTTE
jgi:hypothetical protein